MKIRKTIMRKYMKEYEKKNEKYHQTIKFKKENEQNGIKIDR